MFDLFKVKTGSIRAAAEHKDHEEVARLLKRLKDISSMREEIQYSLLVAAARDDVLTGYELMKYGADVNFGVSHDYQNAEENGFRPPIFNAVECSSITFLQFLLSRGADVNNFERRGQTPLVAAYYYCKTEEKTKMLALLLAAGADPDLCAIKDQSFSEIYNTQEHGASFYGDEKVVFHRTWAEEFKKSFSKNGFELFDRYGLVGLKRGNRVIVHPYFTRECMRFIPNATYLFVSDKMDQWLNEVILLDRPNLNKKELWDIADVYSISAPMWYYDDVNGLIRILSDSSDRVVRIFRNGLYYLYDLSTRRVISFGYSFIDQIQNDGLRPFALGDIRGKLDQDGRERSFHIS